MQDVCQPTGWLSLWDLCSKLGEDATLVMQFNQAKNFIQKDVKACNNSRSLTVFENLISPKLCLRYIKLWKQTVWFMTLSRQLWERDCGEIIILTQEWTRFDS